MVKNSSNQLHISFYKKSFKKWSEQALVELAKQSCGQCSEGGHLLIPRL